jgi:hypothetical protein
MNLRTSAAFICLVRAVLSAQSGPGAQDAAPRTLTVCDVLSKPLSYDGELVRIRGEIVGTDEGTWFKGEECPAVMVTDGYVWGSLISIEFPGSPFQIHPVNFEYDASSVRRLTPRYKKLRRGLPDRCIAWTYTGLFETRKEWSKMMNGNPRGFGHLNGAPGELIIKSVDDVAPALNCR